MSAIVKPTVPSRNLAGAAGRAVVDRMIILTESRRAAALRVTTERQ